MTLSWNISNEKHTISNETYLDWSNKLKNNSLKNPNLHNHKSKFSFYLRHVDKTRQFEFQVFPKNRPHFQTYESTEPQINQPKNIDVDE